jgi:hypothetical protein
MSLSDNCPYSVAQLRYPLLSTKDVFSFARVIPTFCCNTCTLSKIVPCLVRIRHLPISPAAPPPWTNVPSTYSCPDSPICSCSTRNTIVDLYPHTKPDAGMLASRASAPGPSHLKVRRLSHHVLVPICFAHFSDHAAKSQQLPSP